MFKQSKKTFQPDSTQTSSSNNKPLKPSQNISKQLLQFLARQIIVLKDIAQSCNQTHVDLTSSRLKQCIHLLQKKLNFSFSDNPQHYHDYIQDFYENQINNLRLQLNQQKIQAATRRRQLQQIKSSYDMLIKQKQLYKHNLQTSRSSKNTNTIQFFQQNTKLKKQLDHCRMLLQQNTLFIQQQAKAIQHLSNQLHTKQKQHKQLLSNYQTKILHFDQYVTKHHIQIQSTIKNLTNQHKIYQTNLKQLTYTKTRILQQRANLQKQLQMKVQQIQLLTKKILEDQIVISKLQKTLSLKQKLIDQLYQEIDSVNGSLSRYGRKEEDFQKMCSQKNQEIIKLQERLRLSNQSNDKLEKKVNLQNKKLEQFQNQNNLFQKQLQQTNQQINKLQNQYKIMLKKLQQHEKLTNKLSKQKQTLQNQLKLQQQRYEQLYQRTKQQKQTVKKQIMTQVNQLVALVQQKQKQVKQLINQKQQLNKELKYQRDGRNQVENNFQKMNQLTNQIQRKIQFLESENAALSDAKNVLQEELEKYIGQVQRLEKIQKQYSQALIQRKSLTQQVQTLKKNSTEAITSQSSIKQTIQKKQTELQQNFSHERKQYKQLINKKDFQIKQLQCKIKILQQELRDSSKLYENQKFKLTLKIKELEDLLKQRYDFSSRFSQQSDNVY